MKFRFSSTIVIQLSGEAEGLGDNFNVITEDKVKIVPTFMTANSDGEVERLSKEEAQLIFAILCNNILHRAQLQTRMPGITGEAPVQAVSESDPDKRN